MVLMTMLVTRIRREASDYKRGRVPRPSTFAMPVISSCAEKLKRNVATAGLDKVFQSRTLALQKVLYDGYFGRVKYEHVSTRFTEAISWHFGRRSRSKVLHVYEPFPIAF